MAKDTIHANRRDPRASGRPALSQADLTAVAAEYGNPVIDPNSNTYKAAITARDGYWNAMAEGLPNAEQRAWMIQGWRQFYESMGYTRRG